MQVTYSVDGWLEKNRDFIPPGVTLLLQRAENALISSMFKGNNNTYFLNAGNTLVKHMWHRHDLQYLEPLFVRN